VLSGGWVAGSEDAAADCQPAAEEAETVHRGPGAESAVNVVARRARKDPGGPASTAHPDPCPDPCFYRLSGLGPLSPPLGCLLPPAPARRAPTFLVAISGGDPVSTLVAFTARPVVGLHSCPRPRMSSPSLSALSSPIHSHSSSIRIHPRGRPSTSHRASAYPRSALGATTPPVPSRPRRATPTSPAPTARSRATIALVSKAADAACPRMSVAATPTILSAAGRRLAFGRFFSHLLCLPASLRAKPERTVRFPTPLATARSGSRRADHRPPLIECKSHVAFNHAMSGAVLFRDMHTSAQRSPGRLSPMGPGIHSVSHSQERQSHCRLGHRARAPEHVNHTLSAPVGVFTAGRQVPPGTSPGLPMVEDAPRGISRPTLVTAS
jgi:hypothetical protein